MGMKRKITADLLEWKNNPDKVGLLIKGARQVGKTYIVDEFGREQYDYYVKLDMNIEEDRAVFSSMSAESVIRRISARNLSFRREFGTPILI